MDKDQTDYSEDSKFFWEQLEKGLILNVIKKGKWGSIRNLEITNILQSNLEAFFPRIER